MHAYDAFLFAYKAMIAALDLDLTTEQSMRVFQTVEKVAAGEITLNVTPAEMALKQPPVTQAMRDQYEKTFQRHKNREQAIAQEIVKAQNGFIS